MGEPLEAWIAERGEAAIWADFPREALEAGERLLRAQAVIDCSPGGQGFFARVQADRRHVHSVDCRIHPLPSARPITPFCSCAAGGHCAHAVAALLYYLGRKTPAGLRKANPAITQWLAELEALHAGNTTEGRSNPRRPEVLIYLLDRDETGAVSVTLRRARPRRQGGYGRLLLFQGLRRAPEGLLTPADRRLLRLLPEPGQPIAGADLHFLLKAMAETGHAHWQSPDNPALQPADARPGRFRWRVGDDGT